jgi:hypothetical protein
MSKNLVINEKWHLGVQECQSTHLFFCLGRAQIFLGLRENFCCPESKAHPLMDYAKVRKFQMQT